MRWRQGRRSGEVEKILTAQFKQDVKGGTWDGERWADEWVASCSGGCKKRWVGEAKAENKWIQQKVMWERYMWKAHIN